MRPCRFFRQSFLIGLLFGSWLGWGDAQAVNGAKFITAQIERNGAILLETHYSAPDREDNASIWGRLEQARFETKGLLEPDADNPHQATLTGQLRIAIVWGAGNPVADASLERLRLVRIPGTPAWQLPRDEVERTAQAAGLSLPDSAAFWWVLMASMVAFCLLGGAMMWWFVRRRRG